MIKKSFRIYRDICWTKRIRTKGKGQMENELERFEHLIFSPESMLILLQENKYIREDNECKERMQNDLDLNWFVYKAGLQGHAGQKRCALPYLLCLLNQRYCNSECTIHFLLILFMKYYFFQFPPFEHFNGGFFGVFLEWVNMEEAPGPLAPATFTPKGHK